MYDFETTDAHTKLFANPLSLLIDFCGIPILAGKQSNQCPSKRSLVSVNIFLPKLRLDGHWF